MSFCTKCGAQTIDKSAKFCYKCGAPLVIEDIEQPVKKKEETGEVETIKKEDVEFASDEDIVSKTFNAEIRGARAHELGVKLEMAVEKILKAEGYTTERRKRMGEKVKSEMDIVALKTRKGYKDEIIVECKNYSSPIPVKEVQAFESKMRALGKKNGLFAAIPYFSAEAIAWGQNVGLRLWSWENILEKLEEIEVGRYGISEVGRIKYFLPLKISYDEAVKLDFDNNGNVDVGKVKLIWKPYYVFSYKLKCIRVDPRKQKHPIEDSGSYIIDGLSDNFVVQSDAVKNAFKKMLGQAKDESLKTKENDIVLRELVQAPETGLRLIESDEYEIVIHKPIEKEVNIQKRILAEIIKENTQSTYYTLKRDEGNLLPDQHEFRITPSAKEIRWASTKCIYVPKWEIEYLSKEYTYTKIITGNSGSVIYDTITYCNKHVNIGIGRKKNVSVCDICGKALCKEHIWKCVSCGTWRCETHIKMCTSCHDKYCPEHISKSCSYCNEDVCDSCATVCAICGKTYCKKHVAKCSKCERIVCVACSVKEGGILKIGQKVYCKDCKSKEE